MSPQRPLGEQKASGELLKRYIVANDRLESRIANLDV